MAQLYPDEHAQALAELRSCSWHVPEHTIAQLIGFRRRRPRRGGGRFLALEASGQRHV